jgi:putative phosphoribosyl transferase
MRDIFRDRIEAGQLLARELRRYANEANVIVLGLPRGGVPVAFEVAKALRAPLDVFIVRKLGTPGHRELAMGAIATGGVRVLNREVVAGLGIPMKVNRCGDGGGRTGTETARTGLPGQLLRAGGAR